MPEPRKPYEAPAVVRTREGARDHAELLADMYFESRRLWWEDLKRRYEVDRLAVYPVEMLEEALRGPQKK